ncbi:Rieske 2Fe-2S domain-containing protein [Maribacter sp. MMG018]|uniref:QcrA and Rieske domain-containing protein n=1 Tax=Maribacter sp. MMG018 TaxID=2822688 RepID=UPI001B399926|nr:Rieske 2Fe-2S domain-containing protein [Maribacter sp. MMG018]MBQ4914334.1 Rieske 2Fe-2S domain-containing protein [Maribacter sp. MMG018]
MERKQFLKSLGAGAAFAVTFPCLGSCSKDDGVEGDIVEEPTGVDFTIDLTSPEAADLAENGGFILKNLVVVARNLEGNFVAASQVCSHQSYDEVRFVDQEGGFFYCDVHGSRFAQDGSNLNQVDSKTPKPLKIYQTALEGNILRVFE